MAEASLVGPPKAILRVFMEIDKQRQVVGITHISVHHIHQPAPEMSREDMVDDGLGVIDIPRRATGPR